MNLVNTISVASSDQVHVEAEDVAGSAYRANLFPNVKEFIRPDTNLMLINEGSNSNIKSFYIAMFQYIAGGVGHYNPQIRHKSYKVLNETKKHLYRNNTVLTCIKNIPPLQVRSDPRKNVPFTSLEMKKLLGQFFHLLGSGSESKQKVQKILQKFPSILILMNVFMRSLLWLQYDIESAADYNQYIDDQSVFNCLSGLIGAEDFNYSDNQVRCFESRILISNINLMGLHNPRLSVTFNNNKIYMVHSAKDLFKDLTFSQTFPNRDRSTTHFVPSQGNIDGKEKSSLLSFKNVTLRRYDSTQQVRYRQNEEDDPVAQQSPQQVTPKETKKQYRLSAEDTIESSRQ